MSRPPQCEIFVAPVPVVDADEIAFAIALFEGSLEGKIHDLKAGPRACSPNDYFSEIGGERLEGKDSSLLDQAANPAMHDMGRAISALWHHYDGDRRQRAIWSRVMAFQALRRRINTGMRERWTFQSPEDHACGSRMRAVVNAVAAGSLEEFGRFNYTKFLKTVDQFFEQNRQDSSLNLSAADLILHLRQLETVLGPIESLSGRRTVDNLLARALSLSVRAYPWLRYVKRKGVRCFLERPSAIYLPSASQAAEGEVALVTTLLELLGKLVGKAVVSCLAESLHLESPIRRAIFEF